MDFNYVTIQGRTAQRGHRDMTQHKTDREGNTHMTTANDNQKPQEPEEVLVEVNAEDVVSEGGQASTGEAFSSAAGYNFDPASGVSGDVDAQEDSLMADVPVYGHEDTAPRVQALMDQIIQATDVYDLSHIMNFGEPAEQELARVSEQIRALDEKDGILKSGIDASVLKDMGEMNDAESGIRQRISSLGTRAKKFIDKNKGVAAAAAVGGVVTGVATMGLLAPVGALVAGKGFGWWERRKQRKAEEAQRKAIEVQQQEEAVEQSNLEKDAEVLMEEIRTKNLTAKRLETGLTGALDSLKGETANIAKLGQARLRAYDILNAYLGAGFEILRRMNEEELVALREKFEKTGSRQDMANLEERNMMRDQMDSRLTVLFKRKHASFILLDVLNMQKKNVVDLNRRLQEAKNQVTAQWSSLMAIAGRTVRAAQAEQELHDVNKFGGNLMLNTVALVELNVLMGERNKEMSGLDPEVLRQIKTRMTQSHRRLRNMNLASEADRRRALSESHAELSQEVLKTMKFQQHRALGYSPEEARAALEDKSGGTSGSPKALSFSFTAQSADGVREATARAMEEKKKASAGATTSPAPVAETAETPVAAEGAATPKTTTRRAASKKAGPQPQ